MIESSNEASRVDYTVDLNQESESIDPSLQDRVKMGIKYREEDKMTWAAAANKAEVGIQRIRTAIKNKNPDTKSLMGRPPIMSNEQVLRLHDNVTRASLQLKSVLSCRFESMMRETPTEDEEPLKTSISTRSVYNYKHRLDFRERQAQQKPSRRIDAFEEIRNPLSLIGTMGVVYDHVSPSLILSTDDVSILLNGMESKPKVITTEAAIKILRQYNMAVSTSAQQNAKQRVVSFNCTIGGGGKLVCSVMKICDLSFQSFANHPKLFRVSDSLYVLLCYYHDDPVHIQKIIYWHCILPSTEKYKRELIMNATDRNAEIAVTTFTVVDDSIQEEINVVNLESSDEINNDIHTTAYDNNNFPCTTQDVLNINEIETLNIDDTLHQEYQPEGNMSDEVAELWYRHVCLLCDGALPQMKAMEQLQHRINDHPAYMLYLKAKYAAGCSMTQQANDTGPGHMMFHAMFHSHSFKYEQIADNPGYAYQRIKSILAEHLAADSFETIWKAVSWAQTILDRSFDVGRIRSSFKAAGTVTVNPITKKLEMNTEHILNHCPAYRRMSNNDKNIIRECIPQVIEYTRQQGIVREEQFDELLSSLTTGSDSKRKAGATPLNNLSISRQRSCIYLFQDQLMDTLRQRQSSAQSSSAVIGAPIVVKQVKCASGSLFSCKSAVSSDKIAATAGWKCCRRCCKRWTCPKEKCQELLNVHEEAKSCRVAKKPKV